MKLTSIEVHPENSSEIAILSFRDPNANNPYNIKGITGLDADEIIPKYYGASGDGRSKFYNLSLQKREVVFKVGLNPNFSEYKTYSDLRSDLYRMISSSRTGKIQLQFKNGTDVVASVSGFISKFESPLFEKSQEVQFTVKCDEPLLKSPEAIIITGLINTRTDIQDDISTAPHGFSSKITIIANIPDLMIFDPDDASWAFGVTPSGGFLIDDVFYFNSELNNKSVFLQRDDDFIQLADVLFPGSMWPVIFPGLNTFSLSHPTSVVWDSIGYVSTYWGV